MSSRSRLANTRRNLYTGLIKQVTVIGLNFAVRTAIIYILSAEYQGLSDLFTSILHVLNMSDLGFAVATTCILYKPIANNDTKSICAIISFLRKVYRIVGLTIMGIGLVLMPFLPNLISGSYPAELNLYVLFLLYLINSASSYLLFAYKGVLLTALQRDDMVSNAYIFSNIATKVLQIVLLFVFQDYYIFVLLLPVGNIVNNLLLEYYSRNKFPQYVPMGSIAPETRKELIKQVKGIFINRIGDIARNSFDNIIISSFLGLVAVTIYNNYYYIYSAVYGAMGIIVHAMMASVGNSLVTESVEKNYGDMQKFTFIFMWIVGWCTICLGCLYQPFMNIWMDGNQDMLLSTGNMILFCIYLYAISMTYTKGLYLETKGLFHECRKWYILEAIGNLILNFILCYYWGIAGVLLATIITIVLFNFVGGTSVLFTYYFREGKFRFYFAHACYIVVTIINFIISYNACCFFTCEGTKGLIINFTICMIIPNLIYILSYHKKKEFSAAMELGKRFIAR